jgi:hypothetical protein
LRPSQEALDPNYDPWAGFAPEGAERPKRARRRHEA